MYPNAFILILPKSIKEKNIERYTDWATFSKRLSECRKQGISVRPKVEVNDEKKGGLTWIDYGIFKKIYYNR